MATTDRERLRSSGDAAVAANVPSSALIDRVFISDVEKFRRFITFLCDWVTGANGCPLISGPLPESWDLPYTHEKDDIIGQFFARGLEIMPWARGTRLRVFMTGPVPGMRSRDLPANVTLAAHEAAVDAWIDRETEKFASRAVEDAVAGREIGPTHCLHELKLIVPHVNRRLKTTPIQIKGVQCIVQVHVAGSCALLNAWAPLAHINASAIELYPQVAGAEADPFATIRAIAARRPAPEIRDRVLERAAEDTAAARVLPDEKTLKARAQFAKICESLLGTDECPFRWQQNPLSLLCCDLGLTRYFCEQLQARGFRLRGFSDARVELVEPNAEVATPDVPARLTIEAHKAACEQWKAKASVRFIALFAERASKGENCIGLHCDKIEFELIPYMNKRLAEIPFEHNGKRSIIVAHQISMPDPGSSEPSRYAIGAKIREAVFKD